MNSTAEKCEILVHLVRPGSIRFVIARYIFPFQFVVGITGNTLNLAVLNSLISKNSVTTMLLSSLAASDLCFLLVMFPTHFLASFDSLALTPWYRRFYYQSRIPFIACANWFSAASIWFTLAVTIERVIMIRRPIQGTIMKTRRKRKMAGLNLIIFSLSFAITFYYNLWYSAVPDNFCSNVTGLPIKSFRPVYAQRNDSTILHNYVWFSIITGAFGIVAVPMTFLIILNVSLVHQVRKSRNELRRLGNMYRHVSVERKMTMTVITIVASFIVLNCPSAILHLWHLGSASLPSWHATAVEVSNSLVTTSKIANFILYCMGSKHFRRKTMQALRCHFYQHRILQLDHAGFDTLNRSNGGSRAVARHLSLPWGPVTTRHPNSIGHIFPNLLPNKMDASLRLDQDAITPLNIRGKPLMISLSQKASDRNYIVRNFPMKHCATRSNSSPPGFGYRSTRDAQAKRSGYSYPGRITQNAPFSFSPLTTGRSNHKESEDESCGRRSNQNDAQDTDGYRNQNQKPHTVLQPIVSIRSAPNHSEITAVQNGTSKRKSGKPVLQPYLRKISEEIELGDL